MRRGNDDDNIEFLAPDEGAFGASTHAEFVGVDSDDWPDDQRGRRGQRGSRWPRGAAGALVIGLIAAGIVAADPWGNSNVEPSPTTTTAAPRNTAATSGAATSGRVTAAAPGDPLADVPISPIGYLVDELPSDDWVFTGTYSVADDTDLGASPMEVWAEPGATRTTRRWVSARALGDHQDLVADATRIAAGTREAIALDRSGVTVIRVEDPVRDLVYELEGFGLTLDAMVDLAAQIDQDADGLNFGSAEVHFAGMRLELASERPPWSTAVLGDPGAVTNYFDPVAERGIELAFRPVAAEPITGLFLEPTDQPGTFLLSGDTDQPVALRQFPDGLVTITGYRTDPATLTAVANSIRRATLDEWRSSIVLTNRGLEAPQRSSAPSDRAQRGVLDDGTDWLGIQTPRFVFGSSSTVGWYGEVATVTGGAVQALANPRLTVLVATVTRNDPARTLRVTVGEGPPVDVPLEQLGEEPIFGAVFPFTELGPYVYELR